MDQSLIEAVFKSHSRSHAAVNCLKDQLQSLELLQDSARQKFALAQESGEELDKSGNSLMRASSRFLIPSPQISPPRLEKCPSCGSNSPSKMRLSQSGTLDFDSSAILGDASLAKSLNGFDSTTTTSSMNDDLLSMLEKISTTGQQLRADLQSAKLREADLIHRVMSKKNGFRQSSPTKASMCAHCNGEKAAPSLTLDEGSAMALKQRCEKLQDAMLSLEEENMRLNRLLLQYSDSANPGSGERVEDLKKKVTARENEVKSLNSEVQELKKRLTEAEKVINSQNFGDAKETEKQLAALCSRLQEKANSLQKQNYEYMTRMQSLELKMDSRDAVSNVETYKLRIDDLHNLLITKEGEIKRLKNDLSFAIKKSEEVDKRVEVAQTKDISKRKEVLLLCEKYEQLRKRTKRLEVDLNGSQKKLQESTTQVWALETACQRTAEENEVLKHQLRLLEGFMSSCQPSKDSSGASSRLLKDYERLTEKYESLLDLRLREYEKLKASKNKRALKRLTAQQELDRLEREYQSRNGLHDVDRRRPVEAAEDPMWKRERDFRRYRLGDSAGPAVRSLSDHDINSRGMYRQDPLSASEAFPPFRSTREEYSPEERSCHPDVVGEQALHRKSSEYRQENVVNYPWETEEYCHGYRSTREVPAMTKDACDVGRHKIVSRRQNVLQERNCGSGNGSRTLIPDAKSRETQIRRDDDPYFENSRHACQESMMTQRNLPSTNEVPFPRSNVLQTANNYLKRASPPLRSVTPREISLRFDAGTQDDTITRSRSRSLSPLRSTRLDEQAKTNESLLSMSGESQKSVSFLLSPTHRRTKSTSALEIGTPMRIGRLPTGGHKAISPVEVLEKVKSAYQEEYVRNMQGVDIRFSPENLENGKSTDAILQQGASLCGERYKKTTESVRNFLDRPVPPTPSRSPVIRQRFTSRTPPPLLCTPPKSILKKSRSPDDSLTTPRQASSSSVAAPTSEKPPIVVREKDRKFSGTFFQAKRERSPGKDDSVEIVDVSPMPINRDGAPISLNSSLSRASENSTAESDEYVIKNGNGAGDKVSAEDLITPIQFSNPGKDDDTESQSSLSSARDHIGRFEFLQEMQSALKHTSFRHQRPAREEASTETNATGERSSANVELGLSARQQEYAEKLVRKYTKNHAGQD